VWKGRWIEREKKSERGMKKRKRTRIAENDNKKENDISEIGTVSGEGVIRQSVYLRASREYP
jgi:hypothetical protein